MRILLLATLALLVACPEPSEKDTGPAPSDSGISATDTSATDTSATDTSATDTSATDTGACRDEGETCTIYEDGSDNCCNSRHTCFPEGCYYSLP